MRISYNFFIIHIFYLLFLQTCYSTSASLDQISYTVALQMSKNNSNYTHFCTGAIINDQLILTTTQCVQYNGYQFKPAEINVSSAAIYINETTNSDVNQYEVKNVINILMQNNSQPEFSLLHLKKSINFSKKFRQFSWTKPEFTVTGGNNIAPPKWCKKMGVKTPRKLHVRTSRMNCGTTGLFRGKFIYYICIAGRFLSTELCYGFKGARPILFKDFLIGFKVPLPFRDLQFSRISNALMKVYYLKNKYGLS